MVSGKGLCTLHKMAWVLVIVGALNWGVIGVTKTNLVQMLLVWPTAERLAYVLVGVAALMMLTAGRCCMKNGCACSDETCSHCGPDEKKP